MNLAAHIFRQYDIRGVVGKDFGPDVTRAVGRAYGTVLRKAVAGRSGGRDDVSVAVGCDNRPSSPELTDNLISGLRSVGVDVFALGTVPTPVTYWAENTLDADGAIQITGSHNPSEWNGIKMTFLGRPFYGDDVTALRERILAGDFLSGKGSRTDTPVLDRYVEDVAGRIELSRPVRLVADCGNGTGSVVAVRLLEAIGAEVDPLYCESDGTFPNHHPDPSLDETLTELIERVRSTGSDFGVAFDGDADRVGVVDDRGRILRGDELLAIFGLDLIERSGPDQLLVYDVKCSQLLPDVYEGAGGRTLMWKTGHSLIKEKMKETGAPIGGELSGHICFADEFIGSDDALYAACRLARLVSDSSVPLSERTDSFPHYLSTPELRIEVTEESKTGIVEDAVRHFSADHEVVDVDGARILFEGGWALLRSSNTQPVLVARFEADSEDRLAAIRVEVESWLLERGVHV